MSQHNIRMIGERETCSNILLHNPDLFKNVITYLSDTLTRLLAVICLLRNSHPESVWGNRLLLHMISRDNETKSRMRRLVFKFLHGELHGVATRCEKKQWRLRELRRLRRAARARGDQQPVRRDPVLRWAEKRTEGRRLNFGRALRRFLNSRRFGSGSENTTKRLAG